MCLNDGVIRVATKRLKAEIERIIMVKIINFILGTNSWKYILKLLMNIRSKNIATCVAYADNSLPLLNLICGKVNNTDPIAIPPCMTASIILKYIFSYTFLFLE